MCLYGNYKWVDVINKKQNNTKVKVDACIADEIQELNDKGVITLGCCCGHGEAGQIREWENAYGRWKSHIPPPEALIDGKSVDLVIKMGYRPFQYHYADGKSNNVWQIFLKTGCLTTEDCKVWHKDNNIPYEKHLDII